ncbi:MAG: SiaB family protein kinase [Cytophagales bacterium]|nr:SiaB family protein kinase [Cytophagales bacterium]MDW8383742.1 SiaB family protein kinase [Flammeovirgaceae bacterium]
MKYIYDLHRTMQRNHIILVYEGEFNQDITKSVLAMAERNMDAYGEDNNVKRKVFNVMVECLQNICKHAENYDKNSNAKNNAVFMIGKQDMEYFITSGNAIPNSAVPEMRKRLDRVNSLDKEGLKALYKDIIKNGSLSDKGGAGLGFVDMARKSGNKLYYDFEPINQELSFFSLKTVISRDTSKD